MAHLGRGILGHLSRRLVSGHLSSCGQAVQYQGCRECPTCSAFYTTLPTGCIGQNPGCYAPELIRVSLSSVGVCGGSYRVSPDPNQSVLMRNAAGIIIEGTCQGYPGINPPGPNTHDCCLWISDPFVAIARNGQSLPQPNTVAILQKRIGPVFAGSPDATRVVAFDFYVTTISKPDNFFSSIIGGVSLFSGNVGWTLADNPTEFNFYSRTCAIVPDMNNGLLICPEGGRAGNAGAGGTSTFVVCPGGVLS